MDSGQRKLAQVMLANNGINTVNKLFEKEAKRPPTPSFSGLIRRDKQPKQKPSLTQVTVLGANNHGQLG